MMHRHIAALSLCAALHSACTQTVNDSEARADASRADAPASDVSRADSALNDSAPSDASRPDGAPARDAPDAALPPPGCVSPARLDCVVDMLQVTMTVRAMAIDRAGAVVLGGLAHDTVIAPDPQLLPRIVDSAAVHWVDTVPSLTWSRGVNLESSVRPTFGVSAIMPAADVVVAVNEHDCGTDPTRLTGPCIWTAARDARPDARAIRYRGRYAPDDTIERAMLVHDAIEGGDVTAYVTRSVATPTSRRYAQSAVSGLLGAASPVATHNDALVGRGILDGWRGGGVEGHALDIVDGGVRLLAENLDPLASSPLPRSLDVVLPGDASVAARVAHRGDVWLVLAQSAARLGCSSVRDGGETLLGDVTVLDGIDLAAPLSVSPAGDAFALDHAGPVRIGGRTFAGPATLVATLDRACRAAVLVDLAHPSATPSAPSTLTGSPASGLYVAQNFATLEQRWSEVRKIAP